MFTKLSARKPPVSTEGMHHRIRSVESFSVVNKNVISSPICAIFLLLINNSFGDLSPPKSLK